VYDRQVRRRRAVLALLVVVSLILLTAYFGENAGSPLHAVQRGVITVLSPVEEGASRALKPVRDLFGWFGDTLHAKQERDQLKAQRDDLLRKVSGYELAMEENARLSKLLAIDGSNDLSRYDPYTARVTIRSPNSLFQDTIQVDAGSGDGVRVGQPVIDGAGLVGRVSTVSGPTSVVTLITDQSFSVSGRVLEGKGEWGLVKPSLGDPNDLLVQQLNADAPIRLDDLVVTAGSISSRLQSLYPRGIPIGRVTKADPQELADKQQVHISPLADLRHLDFVQILIGRTGTASGGVRAQVP
jgi:rod shape-determining protein MreC